MPSAIIEREPGCRGRDDCWNWRRWDVRHSRRAGGADHHTRMLADGRRVLATSRGDEFWRRVVPVPASWQAGSANWRKAIPGKLPAYRRRLPKPGCASARGCQNHVRTKKAVPIYLD
jgi:hypothetical protein